MQIEEVNDATREAEAKKQDQNGYTFVTVPLDLPTVFPNFKAKETLEKFR